MPTAVDVDGVITLVADGVAASELDHCSRTRSVKSLVEEVCAYKLPFSQA